jgi:selenocysteine lyase/cysteine desulfurase
MDPALLRAQFPVLERIAFLNAGSDGPIPEAAVRAAAEQAERELRDGRTYEHWLRRGELEAELRAAYAFLVGATPADVALTTGASEGLSTVLAAWPLEPGDEVLTSDEEHPGLLGPLGILRRRGVRVRVVPWAELADEVSAATKLVACSHVSWVSGAFAPAALAQAGVPVVFDGAQGAGAVPVDVGALGCAAYAAAGQKWLCGAEGTGFLYVAPEWRERLPPTRLAYGNLEDPDAGLDAEPARDARRFDQAALVPAAVSWALAGVEVLEAAGWEQVHDRGRTLAAGLRDELRARGAEVRGGEGTLVAWRDDDAEATARRLADEHGVVVRFLPGRGLVRASVGAWNDESDLERLLGGLGGGR